MCVRDVCCMLKRSVREMSLASTSLVALRRGPLELGTHFFNKQAHLKKCHFSTSLAGNTDVYLSDTHNACNTHKVLAGEVCMFLEMSLLGSVSILRIAC